jgi:alpha-tubulin suppressor-like RCC1 family protein
MKNRDIAEARFICGLSGTESRLDLIVLIFFCSFVGCSDHKKDTDIDTEYDTGLYSVYTSTGNDWIDVTVGTYHACGLHQDGRIECWGCQSHDTGAPDDVGQCDPPEGAFIQLGTTWVQETCAITDSSTAMCWGHDGLNESPDGVTVINVSSGETDSCLLSDDNLIYCWGWEDRYPPPAELDGEELLSIETGGDFYACVQLQDQTVRCWGYEDTYSTVFNTDEAFSQFSLGAYHACGVNLKGEIKCFTIISVDSTEVTENIPAGTFTEVGVGSDHACAIDTDGAIHCWGEDTWGRLDAPSGVFTSLDVGHSTTCALREDGYILCWAHNFFGNVAVP